MAPASVNGVRTTIWPGLGHLDDAGGHRRVEPQRRAGVDDGHQRRLALELRPVDAARDPAHLDAVADAAPAQRVGVGRLVGQRVDVAQRLEVADVGRDVDRLDRVAAGQVQDVEVLAELEEVLEVGAVARASAAFQVRAVGRARDRREHHVLAADLERARRIAGVHRERARAPWRRPRAPCRDRRAPAGRRPCAPAAR